MTKKHANRQKKSLPAEQAETKELEAHEEYGQVMHSRMDNLFSDLDQMVGDDKTDPVAARLETPNLERAHDDDRIELILPAMASSELDQPYKAVNKKEVTAAPPSGTSELEQGRVKNNKKNGTAPLVEAPKLKLAPKKDKKSDAADPVVANPEMEPPPEADDKPEAVEPPSEASELEQARVKNNKKNGTAPLVEAPELEQPSEVVDKEESDAPATEIPELEQPLTKDDKLESAAPAIESPETEQPGEVSTKEGPDPHALETPEMEQPHHTDEKVEPAAPTMAAPDMEQPPETENKSESAVPAKVNSEIEPPSEADDKTETTAPTKTIPVIVQPAKVADKMGQNILYIEDNPDNMLLVKRALESRGYTLYQAENGLDGVSIAENNRLDLILLDINLPDIDGYEVARRLRKSGKPELAYIPIIAITANALKGDAELSLQAGCDVYMSKPVNIRELWARIEAYVPSVV